MISVSSVDFLLIYGITGRQRSHADHDDDHNVHDDDVDDVDYDVGNDDIFSFVENTFGVITATRSLSFSFPPYFALRYSWKPRFIASLRIGKRVDETR